MELPRRAPRDGYDVCWVTLPDRSVGDIQVASEYVVHAVRTINARSGRKVDIVGHSQGGLEPRWALRWWPSLLSKVDDLVTLATPNHGTIVADPPGPTCPACWQMKHHVELHRRAELARRDTRHRRRGAVVHRAVQHHRRARAAGRADPDRGAQRRVQHPRQRPDVCPGPSGRPRRASPTTRSCTTSRATRSTIPGPAVPARASGRPTALLRDRRRSSTFPQLLALALAATSTSPTLPPRQFVARRSPRSSAMQAGPAERPRHVERTRRQRVHRR